VNKNNFEENFKILNYVSMEFYGDQMEEASTVIN
jgi:hypothetical protein